MICGWVGCFKLADMKNLFELFDPKVASMHQNVYLASLEDVSCIGKEP